MHIYWFKNTFSFTILAGDYEIIIIDYQFYHNNIFYKTQVNNNV